MSLPPKSPVTFDDFAALDIRVGTIRTARLNEKAKKPAYVLEIDFGAAIGMKTTSAQITDAYSLTDLPGRQIVAVLNFPPKKVANIVSDVLVLGVTQPNGPTILLAPTRPVADGNPVA
jgi:tRNA-binding protein